MEKRWYVGATPPPLYADRVREVLIHELPPFVAEHLNDRITWYAFETRSEALEMVEKLQQQIENNLIA